MIFFFASSNCSDGEGEPQNGESAETKRQVLLMDQDPLGSFQIQDPWKERENLQGL